LRLTRAAPELPISRTSQIRESRQNASTDHSTQKSAISTTDVWPFGRERSTEPVSLVSDGRSLTDSVPIVGANLGESFVVGSSYR
jgi:hypothetical protein